MESVFVTVATPQATLSTRIAPAALRRTTVGVVPATLIVTAFVAAVYEHVDAAATPAAGSRAAASAVAVARNARERAERIGRGAVVIVWSLRWFNGLSGCRAVGLLGCC